MSKFKSINPYDQQLLETFDQLTDGELEQAVHNSEQAFLKWREIPMQQKAECMHAAAEVPKNNKQKYARDITLEMGKPISEAVAEIEKCAWVCEYYAENAANFLADKPIETDADLSFVSYEPLGPVLAVMPWNYPFWQVFRFAAPNLMAGNTGILKHASNVMRSGLNIESVFRQAGFPAHVFQSLRIDHDQVAELLKNPAIKAVTLTGSEQAGRSVAADAGQQLKKSVLELGGSNAFVVLADTNLEDTAELAVQARFQNTGQSCIAAKRFVVEAQIYAAFVERFIHHVKQLKVGDPTDESTDLGPMARTDLAEDLMQLLQQSINQGAQVILGGQHEGPMFEPTVVTEVTSDMPIMQAETFGPLAPIIRANGREHAIALATDTDFGLGVTVCTQDIDFVKQNLYRFSDGAVFVNELVKSDPRLPFGGTGISGYGRELAKDGIMEFINKKTVYIKH